MESPTVHVSPPQKSVGFTIEAKHDEDSFLPPRPSSVIPWDYREQSFVERAHPKAPGKTCMGSKFALALMAINCLGRKFDPRADLSLCYNGTPVEAILASDDHSTLVPSDVQGIYIFNRQRALNLSGIIDRLSKIANVFYTVFSEDLDTPNYRKKSIRATNPLIALAAIRNIAMLTLNQLYRQQKLTNGEFLYCAYVFNSISPIDFKGVQDDRSLKFKGDVFARIFREKLLASLPDLLPNLFSRAHERGINYGSIEREMMGDKTLPITLHPRLKVMLCPDSEARIKMNSLSASALRDVMIELRVRASISWVFTKKTPQIFIADPLKALTQYGFSHRETERPNPNDLVVYFDAQGTIVHYAVYVSEGRVKSKWEGMPPMEHPIDGLPSVYRGTEVAFFQFDHSDFEQKVINLVKDVLIKACEKAATDQLTSQFKMNLTAAKDERTLELEVQDNQSDIYSANYYQKLCERLISDMENILKVKEKQRMQAKLATLLMQVMGGEYFNRDFQSEEFQATLAALS